jgi:glycosyltransferase 2 family protein
VKARTLWNIFKYLLAFGLLAWVVYRDWAPASGRGLREVWQNHVIEGQPIHGFYLLAGFTILLASVFITLIRWYVLVRAQNLPFTVSQAMRIGMIGYFYNTVLPGAVGGDIIKAAAIAREQSRRTIAVATVIMDRVIALWGLIWFVAVLGGIFWAFGLLEGPASPPAQFIITTAAAIVAVSVVVWLLLGLLPPKRAERFAGRLSHIPRIGASAAEFWRAVWMYRLRPKSVALALLLSWVSHVGFVVSFYCCARTLWDGLPDNPMPSLVQNFLIVPIGMIISAIPLFPGGAGIGEAGFGGLYRLFGSDRANGILGSLVQRILTWVLGLGGYLVLLRVRSSQPASRAATTSPVPVPTTEPHSGIPGGLVWQPTQPSGAVLP